jgi:hypothetical protein
MLFETFGDAGLEVHQRGVSGRQAQRDLDDLLLAHIFQGFRIWLLIARLRGQVGQHGLAHQGCRGHLVHQCARLQRLAQATQIDGHPVTLRLSHGLPRH